MSKKDKKPRKPKEPAEPTAPPPATEPGIGVGVPVTPPAAADFQDPDPENPIKDVLNTNGPPVGVIVVQGKTVDGYNTALVHVQSGQSSELLTAAEAKKKFVQDAAGNVYYGVHGFAIAPPNTKPVDVVALAS